MNDCPCGGYIADPDLEDDAVWEYCKCGHVIEEHEDSYQAPCLAGVAR